ncbi:DMT family transporter [Cytophagaceae bacterium YF14B1]|uniref:DMT family transporter n=1 Tax=Xanthocytophaga flava TaxID=3048013 RepID=A0AAE3QP14_9BACT|nr:DMT family transporter [Xanthocytophaga flavus]MDJ1482640.1 DMT family transporter [Xanthocytophaga flavus]
MKAKGYVCAIVSAITYGLIPLFILPIKQIHFSLNVALFYRFSISALFLLILLKYTKESLRINRSELMTFVVLGGLFAMSSDFLFLAYDYLSAGIASTILFVYPVIVALIMAIFFKERITLVTAISLIITLAGVYILSTKGSAFDINFTGLSIALSSALCYSLYIVKVNKSKVRASGVKTTFFSLLFSAMYYLLKSLLWKESLLLPNVNLLLDITIFGLLTSVISITTLVYAIRYIGSTPTAILGALEPVVAVLISVLLFHELLTLQLIIGIICILAGVLISIVFSGSKDSEEAKREVSL